ncbi:MAG TPA: MBL fold metallo-hydrolase [Gemmataceae bacterium]|jgi:metallo-beta-lactamase class B|nr:MBL fold metallo-hydrolase [Gemmataceae bacterium]
MCWLKTSFLLAAAACLVACASEGQAQFPPVRPGGQRSGVPAWDARGVGNLSWQGIACLDVSDDGKEIAVGTIAPPGDPNVIVLDERGKVVRQYQVGQRWINQVAFDGSDVLAVCTMPTGKAGDHPELFRCSGDEVTEVPLPSSGGVFHYGDHSNHVTLLLARHNGPPAVLSGNQVIWPTKGEKKPRAATFPLGKDALAVSLSADGDYAVVGTAVAAPVNNLFLLKKGEATPVWMRSVNTETAEAPKPEKGLYGTPTLPDGTREELPQRDEKVWAPLSVSLHVATEGMWRGQWKIAVADYQGWQRWVRSSATMKDESLGIRFMPAKPVVTVYDDQGKVLRRFDDRKFAKSVWCDLRFLYPYILLESPHQWTCRGLSGQSLLLAGDEPILPNMLDVADGKLVPGQHAFGPGLSWVSVNPPRSLVAQNDGIVRMSDQTGKELWQTDLNLVVKRTPKPWVANARTTPIAKGVWQLPGGRVESDLGGQWLIEAPDGLILIEGHAGLSFEREWESIKAVGLDPMKVKYVLATHEHGDHAPGAYLWRVVTGAQFVCSEEMAYNLQHHIPATTGYGFHPPVPTDIKITKDTELDLAGLKVRAIRIPGHTYGSMAWQFEKDGKSFVAFGDLIIPKGVLGYSGSINFSARDALASLRKLQALKPDVVLPGHGNVEGPENYFKAGIDVGVAGGWGLIKPEKPDPYFRITQKNVLVVGWNIGATSAAFGDIDGDGLPDVALVSPDGEGSKVSIFLNKGGKFADKPDQEIRVPSVANPHKIHLLATFGKRARVFGIFVAGKSAALLWPGDQFQYTTDPLDPGDGNHARVIDWGEVDGPFVSRRFGGFQFIDQEKGRVVLKPFKPDISGPYVDFQLVDLTYLVTSRGQVFLLGTNWKLPEKPSLQLEVEKDDWTFLAVGDFNGDGKPDIALLAYGMNKQTSARIFYNTGDKERPFHEKPDAIIPLNPTKKNEPFTLLRDAPVVVDWNGDGIADLIIGRGQSNEVLILFGSKDGLDIKRSTTIELDYRVHYETGLFAGDFNSDGRPDLAAFGYTLTGVGWSGPTAAYIWLQPPPSK